MRKIINKLTDFVKIYDNVITDEFCVKIINAFDADGEFHIDSTIGALEGTDNVYRSAIEMNCTKRADKSAEWGAIMSILNRHASNSFRQYCNDLIEDGFSAELLFSTVTLEQWRMHRYDPGKHYYKEHIDSIEFNTSRRMLVLMYYLNTVKEGGETSFDTIGIQVKPREGRLVIAPTWFGYPHSGDMPISNTKYMIKTYLHYPGDA